jgi:hypothetical protein
MFQLKLQSLAFLAQQLINASYTPPANSDKNLPFMITELYGVKEGLKTLSPLFKYLVQFISAFVCQVDMRNSLILRADGLGDQFTLPQFGQCH